MSSGEGAEETSKDAADIAAFFKSGKPENEHAWESKRAAPSSRHRGTLFPIEHCIFGIGALVGCGEVFN